MSRVFVSCSYRDRGTGQRVVDMVRGMGLDADDDREDPATRNGGTRSSTGSRERRLRGVGHSASYTSSKACRYAAKHAATLGPSGAEAGSRRSGSRGLPLGRARGGGGAVRPGRHGVGRPALQRLDEALGEPEPEPQPVRLAAPVHGAGRAGVVATRQRGTGAVLERALAVLLALTSVALCVVAVRSSALRVTPVGLVAGVRGRGAGPPATAEVQGPDKVLGALARPSNAVPGSRSPPPRASSRTRTHCPAGSRAGYHFRGPCGTTRDARCCTRRTPTSCGRWQAIRCLRTPVAARWRQADGEVAWNLDGRHNRDHPVAEQVLGGLDRVTEVAGRLFCTGRRPSRELVWTQDPHLLVDGDRWLVGCGHGLVVSACTCSWRATGMPPAPLARTSSR